VFRMRAKIKSHCRTGRALFHREQNSGKGHARSS
jgi:hypothetical protein